ncbi:MAG: cytidylate kinase-like family protein [Treponema sp.]|nr:cytidylate kinase-like family protein [Treponema sp.]
MAVISISRQLASLGDEVASRIAEKLGYKLVTKTDLEKRIVSLGFPENKLPKFEEKKLGFLTGLTNLRDEYLNCLMTAILEAAGENNTVIVGRDSFIILKDIDNHISIRCIAEEKLRIERIQKEYNLSAKKAEKKLFESENHQKSFHKGFFNFDANNPEMFDFVVNSSKLDVDSIADSIIALTKSFVTKEKEEAGQKKIDELLMGQRLVDILIFIYNLNIEYLRASLKDKKITLHGIADSQKTLDAALTIVEAELPDFEVENRMSVGRT